MAIKKNYYKNDTTLKNKGKKTFSEVERQAILKELREIQYNAMVCKGGWGYNKFAHRIWDRAEALADRIK